MPLASLLTLAEACGEKEPAALSSSDPSLKRSKCSNLGASSLIEQRLAMRYVFMRGTEKEAFFDTRFVLVFVAHSFLSGRVYNTASSTNTVVQRINLANAFVNPEVGLSLGSNGVCNAFCLGCSVFLNNPKSLDFYDDNVPGLLQ